jgi:hypothetical protein
MSAFEKVLGGIKDILVMREDVSRLADGVKELSSDVRDHEHRLIRIETMVDMARGQQSPPLSLPKKRQ